MKNRLLIVLICLTCIFFITGCKNSESSKTDLRENTSTNDVESNLGNVKTFNIDQYRKIYKISSEFIELLNNNGVSYRDITYKNSEYVDGEYKTVVISLNANENITMKFSNDSRLLVLNLYGGLSENTSKDYENSKLAMLHFEYFNFTKNEILDILSSLITETKCEVGKYQISSIQHPAFNMFIISEI